MKNHETWAFAHKYLGRLWLIIGIIMLPLSVIPMLLLSGDETNAVWITGVIIVVLQMILLIVPIFATENALKRNEA